MPITLSESLTDYYDTRLRRLSPSTRENATFVLEAMRTWITKETQPQVYLCDIDDRLMVRFFNRFLPPGHAPSTYNNYRQQAGAFWQFCRGEDWITVNPMRHVDRLPVPRKVRLVLSPDELKRMLADAPPRDRFALALGVNTSLRQGDVTRLTVGSPNLGNGLLQAYNSKSKTEMNLPITGDLRDELLRWLPEYGRLAGMEWRDLPNNWPLVPAMRSTPHGGPKGVGPMEARVVPGVPLMHLEYIVHRALARLGHGSTKGEGFHTLRRSGLRITYDLAVDANIGDPIRIAQVKAGHKSRTTTEIYLGITHEQQLLDDLERGRSFLDRASDIQRKKRDDEGDELRVVR